MQQMDRARFVSHRAAILIAAGALSLTLAPGIALADTGSADGQPSAAQEQISDQASSKAAGSSTSLGVDAEGIESTSPGASNAEGTNSAVDATNTEGANTDADTAKDQSATSEEAASKKTSTSPLGESATAPIANGVAKIGETEYATFDEAITAAKNGETIELLADATSGGLNLDKDLTINGGEAKHSLTFNDKGIALWGKALIFKNIKVIMNGIGSTPYTAEWNWMTISASKNASLTLDNASLLMDGAGTASNTHAIYFCSNNKLNIKNGSNLTIKNYQQDALEWDGGDGGYNVNISNGSTFVSDHNRSGFTGTFYATIDNSTVKVLNSASNGSNGTYYTIKNGSDVLFDNNGNWGISAWRIDMTGNSKLKATNNGYSGVWTRVLNLDSTCSLYVENNGTKAFSAGTNPGIVFQGNGSIKSEIAKGATVVIRNNAGSGIYTKQNVCNLTIGSATITNNGTGSANKSGIGAEYGGGIYNVGTIKLDPSVQIYNNHASKAGDDLFGSDKSTTSFGDTGSDWVLDDCGDQIDAWYNDPENSRWNAHPEEGRTAYVVSSTSGAYEGQLALKAAHGLTVDYHYVGEFPENADKPKAETGLQTLPYNAATQGAVPGWTFDGWYTDESCTIKWNDGDALAGSMTLFGKWTQDPKAEPSPAPETSQPGNQPTVTKAAESQQAATPEHLAKTGDALLPFGFAVAGIALIAGAIALISRKLLKH